MSRASRLLAQMQAAVGGDQDGRQIGAETPAQLHDGLEAVAVIEVIVDQQTVGRGLVAFASRPMAAARSGACNTCSPSRSSSVCMPSSTAGRCRGKAPRGRRAGRNRRAAGSARRRLDGAGARRGTSTEKREPPPGVERRSILWSSMRAMRSHDRQAEAQPARDLGALVEPVEFLEDLAPLRRRDADAGIVDVDPQPAAPPPAADQHAAVRRIFDGVGDEVLHQPAQQPAVRAHRRASTARKPAPGLFRAPAARTRPRSGAAARRCGSWTNSGLKAPVSSREMSSSAPRISSTASSDASMLLTSRRRRPRLAARSGW